MTLKTVNDNFIDKYNPNSLLRIKGNKLVVREDKEEIVTDLSFEFFEYYISKKNHFTLLCDSR